MASFGCGLGPCELSPDALPSGMSSGLGCAPTACVTAGVLPLPVPSFPHLHNEELYLTQAEGKMGAEHRHFWARDPGKVMTREQR